MDNADKMSEPLVPQPLDDWFLSLLACPGCEQRRPLHLGSDEVSLICECGKYSFPITDGIPVLLVENATILNEDATPNQLDSAE